MNHNHCIISSCLIKLHAYFIFRSTSKNSLVVSCVSSYVSYIRRILESFFPRLGGATPPKARKLCSNLRWRWICVEEPGTWDLSRYPFSRCLFPVEIWGFSPFWLAENGDDMNDSIKTNASFRIMDENDVCFHYFYLSIHKLPDDEIVLFGCFIGWSGFSWMVFRLATKNISAHPLLLRSVWMWEFNSKFIKPIAQCHGFIDSTSNKSHGQQLEELRLGWFFCGGCGQQGWDWPNFSCFCWSQPFPFPPQIC